ncbi:MAG: putative glycoside hydrolase [Lachnospiraceae bacterium]
MKKTIGFLLCLLLCFLCLAGCRRYEPIMDLTETANGQSQTDKDEESASEIETDSALQKETDAKEDFLESGAAQEDMICISNTPERTPVKVKGIYLTANSAGSPERMDEIISYLDQTELNAVVIDVKDDFGNVTFEMDSPVVNEIEAVKTYISDMEGLAGKLKEHDVYMIARIPAFRDPYLAEKKPEWCLKLADGSIYKDNKGQAWVNPYKREVWDYLIEIGKKAGEAGFDEIQFDYVRFCTERGMDGVIFEEADTQGRDKNQIIQEFIQYAYDELTKEGLFVSADVFGTIISSPTDARIVGQNYGEMSSCLDYICPMIYPSHYGDGNFGVDYPDTRPYETILGALKGSRQELKKFEKEGEHQAVVRPWLQDFTASYLEHYIPYGDAEVRAQIQAVYDAGYDEWILWSAANRYHYGGLLTPEAAEAEETAIAESRAALEAESISETETLDAAKTETISSETDVSGNGAE